MTLAPRAIKLIAVIFAVIFICACNKKWEFQTGGSVKSFPAVVLGHVYVGSDDSKVYCLKASTGENVWEFETGGISYSSPAVSDGYVYVGSDDGKVYCLRAAVGDRRGVWPMFRYVFERPGGHPNI